MRWEKKGDIMKNYSLAAGSLVVGHVGMSLVPAIAEVVTEEPLVLRVTDKGRLSKLEEGKDFDIVEFPTSLIQKDPCKAINQASQAGHPFVTGLSRFGIRDNRPRSIRTFQA